MINSHRLKDRLSWEEEEEEFEEVIHDLHWTEQIGHCQEKEGIAELRKR